MTGTVPCRAKVGSLSLSFSPERGFQLSDQDVPLIDGSNVRVRNTAWKRVYFNLAETSPNVKMEDSDGAKVLLVSNLPASGQAADSAQDFLYTLRISVRPPHPLEFTSTMQPSQVDLSLTYTTATNLNGKVEFVVGFLNANPIKGQRYFAELRGRETHGLLPTEPILHNTRVRPFRVNFDQMILQSRLGIWSITSGDDQTTLTLADSRGEHWAVEQRKSIFWLGFPEARLIPGKQVTLAATLRFMSAPRRSVKSLPMTTTGAALGHFEVSEARVPVENPIQFIPQPQHFDARNQDFVFNEKTKIYLAPHPTTEDTFVAELVTKELRHLYDLRLPVEPWSEAAEASWRREPSNCLFLGETNVHPGVDLICRKERIEVSPQAPGPEGYAISVKPQYVMVAGADRAGTFHGVQTLLQMMTPRGDGAVVAKGGFIYDYPDFEFRGVHLLADDYAYTWIKELITKVLAPHKINNIVLECEYAKWDSHPEIQSPWGMSKDEMARLKELAERYYIQITPLVQSLGHSEWMFANGKNLDLAEDPGHLYSSCPSNPTCYAFLFDILQEAVDLFKPKYLHIGHDEVTRKGSFGQCARCAGKPASTLFSENVRLIQEYLAARNVKTMMWGDMLLAPSEAQDAAHGGAPYNTYEARTGLSKDVIICDWHYSPYRDYPSSRLFTQSGFGVIGATWHDRRNIYYMSKSAKRAGAFGMLQTTWTGYNGNRTALQRQGNQISAYLVAADYFWSTGLPKVEEFPYRPAVALREALSHKPPIRQVQSGFLVDLSPMCNVDFMDLGQEGGWLHYGLRYDLRRMPVGATRFGSLLFQIPARRPGISGAAVMLTGSYVDQGQFPQSVEVPINHIAHQLAFLHTCGWATTEGQKVGEYEIVYARGSNKTIDMVYGENIFAWDDEINSISDGAVWHGTTVAGTPVSISSFLWENPTPEIPIEKILVRSLNTEAAPALISITGLSHGHTGSLSTSAPTTETGPPVLTQAQR